MLSLASWTTKISELKSELLAKVTEAHSYKRSPGSKPPGTTCTID